MSVLTFLSDFGADSHYMASFRGAMYKAKIELPFIEITSRIEPFDIVEAAYLSSMVFSDFEDGSIHILATNVVATSYKGHLVAKFNNHYFLAPDNGILSLIFGENFNNYYLIPTASYEQKIQNVYLPFITKLLQNQNLDEIARKADKIDTKTRIHPVRDDKELRGTVLFVDHFGNSYTNITKDEFESFVSDSDFKISLSRHSIVESISNNYSDVREGDPICYFSDHGYLVAAIKKSSAEKLLNLRKYKPLIVQKV
ncbi:SAM-dependent chlorinase/fluorinase [Bacteroidia bacterium]|nr:SAM-dependent chlorinase/fluorinase [Bacteroidia bacterium]MDB9881656.1 SAM-dependent chlorinase/fluorinase [Bacteroidia bacterium]